MTENPTWRITALLTVTLGGPYFLLSSTSPLLQRWFARSWSHKSPYRLYALSNAGSFLGLLSYPLLIEPFVASGRQTLGWSWLFVLFAVLTGLSAWIVSKRAQTDSSASSRPGVAGNAVKPRLALLWLALAAIGSIVLLATINQIGRDVPPVPFLVVIPLALYLLTFVIAFEKPGWYRRTLLVPLLIAGIAASSVVVLDLKTFPITIQVSFFSLAVFGCCLACHGELERLKPAAESLTLYYLVIAVGGALGGVFVVIIAPQIFNDVWEFPLGLLASFLLVTGLWAQESRTSGSADEKLPVDIKLKSARRVRNPRLRKGSRRRTQITSSWRVAIAVLGSVAIVTVYTWDFLRRSAQTTLQTRNFYGTVRVVDDVRDNPLFTKTIMIHGTTDHGFQYHHPSRRLWPTAYYSLSGGAGVAIERHPQRNNVSRPFRIGIVGLGVGIISAYANRRPGQSVSDLLTFYEINPDVIKIASTNFSYLSDATERGAEVDIVEGDARLAMEGELLRGHPQHFDVLILDAFSGDSVPMHLLTSECFQIYLSHVAEGGVIAFHVSSRFVDLIPVVTALAQQAGLFAGFVYAPPDGRFGAYESKWVLVTANQAFMDDPVVKESMKPTGMPGDEAVLWTDDFGSLLQVIK